MHLFPAEPEITLYKDGLDKLTTLPRRVEGQRLTDLLDKTSDPLTVAVNGAWGTGKTVFLKCWAGHHTQHSAHNPTVVYFDAFEHDYQNDPLIALTAAISERLDGDKEKPTAAQNALKKMKSAAPAMLRTGIKTVMIATGAGIGTGLVDYVIPNPEETVLDEAAQAGTEALAQSIADGADSFWREQKAQKAAMKTFRDGLTALTEPGEDGKPSKRLIIVIDELDRCRPDYALSMLETLKHVFALPGVQFVLGVNMDALANSVRARYGAGYDAALYLQKFVHLEMRLRNVQSDYDSAYGDYFKHLIKRKMKIQDTHYIAFAEDLVRHCKHDAGLTLRGLQKFARLCAITPKVNFSHYDSDNENSLKRKKCALIVGLMYLKAMHPEMINKIKSKDASWQDINKIFKFPDPIEGQHFIKEFVIAWRLCFANQFPEKFWRETLGNDLNQIMANISYDTLIQLIDTHLEAFEFS